MEPPGVLWFAGPYGLALASDLVRFVVRGRARWSVPIALTALGWLVHTTYLGHLAWRSRAIPLTTVFESLLVLAWTLVAIDLYLLIRSPRPVAIGVFVLPLVLALLTMAGVMAPWVDWTPWRGSPSFWGSVHGASLLAGAASSCVAFVAGLMYLAQAHRLKHKWPAPSGFVLPSLERSERVNLGAIAVAFLLLTLGLLTGLALDLMSGERGRRPLGWSDPKVLSTGATWLAFAGLVLACFRPALRGRRLMVLTILAFAFLAFSLVGVDLLLDTAHGVTEPSGSDRARTVHIGHPSPPTEQKGPLGILEEFVP